MKRISVFSAFFVFWLTVTSAHEIKSKEDAYGENIRKLTLANNELAFNLYRRLVSESSENVFFSSLGISTVFGMLFYGARGNTAKELRETLGYEKADLPNNLVNDSFYFYLTEVMRRKDSYDGNVLKAANVVLVNKKLGVRDEYRRKVQELYKASMRDVDFSKNSALIVKNINDFAEEKTNGMINEVLDKLDPSNDLVLLNAVFFNRTWKTKFELTRRTENFFNNGQESQARRVPFMGSVSGFPYASVDNFQAVELPYKEGNVSMLILLPRQRNGLQDLEKTLTPERLNDIQRRLFLTPVQVYLPKFKLQFEKELSPEIQALGSEQIFKNGADFSGMTSRNNVKVNKVVHKAVIEVNDAGSEDPVIERRAVQCIPPEFWADHPFLIAILDKSSKSNMILFLGRVNNV